MILTKKSFSKNLLYVCIEGSNRNPFFLLVVMVNYGKHFCKNPTSSYYAGWDGLGIENEEACEELCKKDHICNYAASKPGHTCSRYKGESCELKTDSEVLEEEKGHFTFRKLENVDSSTGKI